MDTSLNITLPPTAAAPGTPPVERAITSKVQAVERPDRPATLPPDRPFVAQAVSARLSGDGFPDAPGEIAPPERTLRPYDVPMLPYDATGEATERVVPDTAGPENEPTQST